ncbi:UPF0686 protein C11orf1 homolog [Protopterus annectens]|uniref:UPF0686 protein C11orf1 homolog n=1 Tax=Protopterus annectens TaxID=7888 RepID=UPI001CFB9D02|nr:UPF0686 protein C11orf1 homolog [Protopterus annectens]XP_043936938.1 UPF0686 protein C11orf1 homolog [Protopterus annectens]
MLRATGYGEVWKDQDDNSKFQQYGWRCTTNEDSYSKKTLIGNWSEERCDLKNMERLRPALSQFAHYYQTSHNLEYGKAGKLQRTENLKKESHAFPCHQPELDPPSSKQIPKSCYTLDYTSTSVFSQTESDS